jgi:hypothetical protein
MSRLKKLEKWLRRRHHLISTEHKVAELAELLATNSRSIEIHSGCALTSGEFFRS